MKFIFVAWILFLSFGEIEVEAQDSKFEVVRPEPGVKIDLRYASTNNFTHSNVYGNWQECRVHPSLVKKLRSASKNLRKVKANWNLLLLDCLRPVSVQNLFWEKVVNTPMQRYVANPARGSIHNYGFAVDLTLMDENGNEVDMGTPFDHFGPLAEPRLESKFLKEGKLTPTQVENRKTLRKAMTRAGFIQLESEWWHYDGESPAKVRKKFRPVE